MCANHRIHYNLNDIFVFLHITLSDYHHKADFSEITNYIKCWVCSVECVSKIKSIISIIFYAIYGVVCFQLTHFCFDDCDNIFTFSYYHHQIGSINHKALLRIRPRDIGMQCMWFYVLMQIKITLIYKKVEYNQAFCIPMSWPCPSHKYLIHPSIASIWNVGTANPHHAEWPPDHTHNTLGLEGKLNKTTCHCRDLIFQVEPSKSVFNMKAFGYHNAGAIYRMNVWRHEWVIQALVITAISV